MWVRTGWALWVQWGAVELFSEHQRVHSDQGSGQCVHWHCVYSLHCVHWTLCTLFTLCTLNTVKLICFIIFKLYTSLCTLLYGLKTDFTALTICFNQSMRVPYDNSMQWFSLIFDNPGVVGAVLQTASLLSDSLSHPLWKYLHNTVFPKTLELETWHF